MLNKDFERAAQGLKPLKKEYVSCATCGCNWFDKVEAFRVDQNQLTNLGSAVPPHGGPFNLLRCLRCGDVQEPPLATSHMSPLRTEYDQMLDQVADGKGDTRDSSNRADEGEGQ
jgi:hypothetical protein